MKAKIAIVSLIFTFFFTSLTWGQASDQKIRVVDRDNHSHGVESKLLIIKLDNSEVVFGATDKEGYYTEKVTCQRGEWLKINPMSTLYYFYRERCPTPKTEFLVDKIYSVMNLQSSAEQLEKEGKLSKAALVYNEIMVRLSNYDEQKSKEAEQKVYLLIGKSLGVDEATKYDRSQDKVVASQSLVNAVKDFQEQSNIPVTGKLDYNTLRKSAGKDIGQFLY